MKLYLVRHGETASKEVNPSRPLTDKGRNDVEKMAAFIKNLNLDIPCIRHSTKARAAQTAEILASVLTPKEGVIRGEGLAPNDPIEPLQNELQDMEDSLMIVGHLPFLAKLASSLLIGSFQELIAFQQGGIICLGRGKDKTWQIEWMIIPDLI